MQKSNAVFFFRSLRFVVLICALFCFNRLSYSGHLDVGGTLNPVPLVSDPFSGTEVVKSSSNLQFIGAAFNGFLKSTVLQEDIAHNPLGGLTFVYQVLNSAASANELHRFTVTNFSSSNTDAGYTGTTGVVPLEVDRDTADVFGAGFLRFGGSAPILPGQSSDTLVVRTDATVWQTTTASIIDGSTATVGSFAPSNAIGVPEPGSMTLLAGAVSLMGLLGWRRRKKMS